MPDFDSFSFVCRCDNCDLVYTSDNEDELICCPDCLSPVRHITVYDYRCSDCGALWQSDVCKPIVVCHDCAGVACSLN